MVRISHLQGRTSGLPDSLGCMQGGGCAAPPLTFAM